MASGPVTSWQIGEKVEAVIDFIVLGSRTVVDGDCSLEIKRHLLLGRRAMTNIDSILKSRDITFLTKVYTVKATVFPVVMYGCDSWTIKKVEHQRIDAFKLWCWKRLFENLLDCKETKPVHPKRNQPWILIGRTDAEAENLVLWSCDAKSQLTGKDPDAGRDWRQNVKGAAEDGMVGWHHWLNGHEFEQTPGNSEGQGSLVCCSSWGRKESDMT